ncbi:hypothetical protein LQ327_17940 [Actinomycetospora endophytica]|uniref:DUF6777 domain-containing protein n=1 Tax=Actinomycetospora endophytica TaxID=2291215 RepID=A0ABS8PB55_9PSEU|nr:DUF6777 domain-containing protein [Actinomycetospora endophytica]MCD2195253.1 hypothetical protein [Actinomycetospora endophytica]
MTKPGPYVWAPPPPPRRPQRRTTVTVISVLAALVVILGGVAGFLLWQARTAAASDTTLEPTNSATADAFMPAHGPDASVTPPPAQSGGAVTGSTPGLFGGTLDNSSCDQDQLSQFLGTHQDKAAAWAGAEGIDVGDISTYVHHLTPVTLRADTYITNHGFRDGELTSFPAVLEAGTAVLVDGYGTPRVKCYCGNPVSAPPHHQPSHFEGRPWARFAAVTVIVIQPAPVVVQNLTVVNIQNNVVYNVVVPPWRWGPPPGWDPSSSTGPSSSETSSSSDTSSVPPSSNQDGRQLVAPGTACGPTTVSSPDVAGVTVTTSPTCESATGTTTTGPTTTTTTSPTTTSPTTTSPTTTTTTTTTTTGRSS